MVRDGDAHTPSSCDAALVRAFELLGKRWNGVILSVLRAGPMKFSELRRGVGPITDSMLSDRLVELAEEGMVERTVSGARPSRIAYSLTAGGLAIQPILDQLALWAAENLDFEGDERGAASIGRAAGEIGLNDARRLVARAVSQDR